MNGSINKLKTVLVPIDFSDCSKHALMYAVAFAKQFSAKLTLIAVVQDNRTAFEYGNPEFAAHLDERTKKYKSELTKLADEFLGQLERKLVVTSGRPFEEIVRTAKASDADLIIISTRGYMGLRHAELGSTAERVIRYATCPVLVVREKEHEFVAPIG